MTRASEIRQLAKGEAQAWPCRDLNHVAGTRRTAYDVGGRMLRRYRARRYQMCGQWFVRIERVA